jgi:hypothetical protein
MVTWPSGKAKVCKTFIHQFKSGRHLHKTVMKKLSQSFLLYCRAKKSAALRMLLISLQLKGKLLAETLIFD